MRVAIAVAFLLATISSGAAHAQATSPEGLIAGGLELRRQSKPEPALDLFKRAHALAPSPRTFGQMGLVEASLERWLDAEANLAMSLATPSDPWVRKNRAFLAQALAVTRRHIGELVITGPAGTEVAVDGKPIGILPEVLPVRHIAGNAFVTANGVGFREFSKTVAIAAGARVSLALVMDPIEKRPALALAAPVPTEPAPSAPSIAIATEPGRSAWRKWGGVSLIAAGSGMLAWGITWVVVDGKDQCPTSGPACTTVYDTRTAGWILTAAGAVAAAGGAALLVTARRSEDANVTVAATPSSLLLRGRF